MSWPGAPSTGYLVWRLALKWRAAVDRAVRPLGLTHAQYSLLASLFGLTRSGVEPSQRELSDFSGLEPVYVSKLARSLERAGLVERLDHPSDPRAFSLRLTPSGEDVIGQAIAIVARLQDQLTQPIGGPHSDRGRQLVDTLRTLLREGDPS
jgi:DNA-binding MarR family transcriptional regulator